MVVIVGAGIAGLLAANMMHRRRPVVMEAQPSLPHNHSAVLRFRTSAVGDVLGISFKRVQVVKASLPWENPVADQLAYSRKVSGTSRSDRSLPLEVERVERWIAPPDLITKMARDVDVRFNHSWNFDTKEKVVSTIPMPQLAQVLGYDQFSPFEFEHRPGYNILARIADCEAYVTLYVPNPGVPFSRVSITGDQLIVEFSGDDELPDEDDVIDLAAEAALLLGISTVRLNHHEVKKQTYAKILPIDEGKRRAFIYWASTTKGIAHSLGRFATWRPSLLADDLVKDVRLIDGWLGSTSPGYDMERHERERTR
jgi:hypothetical protein